MRNRWIATLFVLMSGPALLPAHAFAQVQGMPRPVCGGTGIITEPASAMEPLAKLTALYSAGARDDLWKEATRLVDGIRFLAVPEDSPAPCEPKASDLLQPAKNYVAVSWIGHDPLSGKTTLIRVVLHGTSEPGGRTEIVTDLPGAAVDKGDSKLVEVFLGYSPNAGIASVFEATREDDPLKAQLPAFAQAIAAPLIGVLAASRGTARQPVEASARRLALDSARVEQKPPPHIVWAQTSVLTLPYRRATVRLRSSAEDGVLPAALQARLENAAGAVPEKNAAYSACARGYALELPAALTPLFAADGACASDTLDDRCTPAFDAAMRKAYDHRLAVCTPGAPPPKADVQAVRAVDQAFRARFDAARSVSADGDVTFHNRPLTHVSLGAGMAYIAKARLSRPRAKLNDSNEVIGDPLPRVLTTALVNWSPRGYDRKAQSMSNAERFQFFAGAALTPDFGVVGGLNVQLVQGLGFAAGAGLLFGNGADQIELQQEPADPTDPFTLARATMLFVGITYNFK